MEAVKLNEAGKKERKTALFIRGGLLSTNNKLLIVCVCVWKVLYCTCVCVCV